LRRFHSSAFFWSPAVSIRKPTPVVEARRRAVSGVMVFIAFAGAHVGAPGNTFPAVSDP
jgi:hypothetical protein